MHATTTASAALERGTLADFRLIPPVETYPKVVAFAQTFVGKLAVWGLFVAAFWFFHPTALQWSPIALSLLFLTLLPNWRWNIVAVSTVAVTGIEAKSPYFLVVIAVGTLLFWSARRWPQSEFSRRPITFLIVSCTLLILACSTISPNSGSYLPAWHAVGLMTSYLWFVGYALMDRTAPIRNGLALEVGTFHPFWGSANTPFPKGAAYLRRIEARDPEQLAVTQLKGLKLLVWAILLRSSASSDSVFSRVLENPFGRRCTRK